jgi:hypothetical protein
MGLGQQDIRISYPFVVLREKLDQFTTGCLDLFPLAILGKTLSLSA